MKLSHLSLLLEKYENGTCSDAELVELNSWYHSFSKAETDLEEDLTKFPELLNTIKLEVWSGLEEQIRLETAQREPIIQPRFLTISPIIVRIAAVLVLGLSITMAYWIFQPKPNELLSVSTQKNNFSEIKLSDGTIIWVKSGSNLRYPEQFEGKKREVFLDGEAYFEVAHDAEKVFFVHTSDITIKVLGTSFNVKSYKDQNTIETTLVTGSVKIEKTNTPDEMDIVLIPSERAVYDKKSGVVDIVKSVDVGQVKVPERKTVPATTKLIFDETPFSEVFAQLEKRYHVKFHVNDQSLTCKLTADVQQENLEEILKLLEVSHQVKYRISGDDVYVTGKLCN